MTVLQNTLNNSRIIRNVFISSKYRTNQNENPNDFTIHFPENYIVCQDIQQRISVNIINFHMPNSMYNINDNNHTIYIIVRDAQGNLSGEPLKYDLTNGNYNVYELRDHLNDLLTNYVSVSYNKIRNTYTFTNLVQDGTASIFTEVGGKYLGLNNDEEYILNPSVESIIPVNLVSFNKIVMNCEGMNFNGSSIENISSKNGFEISNILFWRSRQDTANMAEIVYDNEDGGNSFNYTLTDKYVNQIRFTITDESYNTLVDLPDWTMILQFTIEDPPSNDILSGITVIQNYLLGIYSMVYLILRKMSIL